MVSWKDSFEKINIELDMANKKKQALDDLYNAGSISQSTYENLGEGLEKEIQEIEARQKVLTERMTHKLNELEQQVQALETFLANSRMSYVTGEITEDMHNQKSNALNFGLEATKQELDFIREVITQLIPEEAPPSPTPETTEVVDTAEETPIETAVEGETEFVETHEEPTEIAVEEEPEAAPSVPIEEPVEVTPVPGETEIETPTPMDMEEATETTQEESPTEEFPTSFQEESEETETLTEEETLED